MESEGGKVHGVQDGQSRTICGVSLTSIPELDFTDDIIKDHDRYTDWWDLTKVGVESWPYICAECNFWVKKWSPFILARYMPPMHVCLDHLYYGLSVN